MRYNISILFIALAVAIFGSRWAYAQGVVVPELRFHGAKICVTDMKEALNFYNNILGFDVKSKKLYPTSVTLYDKSVTIYLELTDKPNRGNYKKESYTGLTIQTNKLLLRIDYLRSKGVEFYESQLRKNGVGISIPFKDPFGNVLNLLEEQVREVSNFEEPKVYNIGVLITDMEKAIDFYENKLGFKEWSRDYLPNALPLKHNDGSFAFMIHYEEGLLPNTTNYPKESQIVIMLETPDLVKAKILLENMNISLNITDQTGEYISVKDPEGNTIEIIKRKR